MCWVYVTVLTGSANDPTEAPTEPAETPDPIDALDIVHKYVLQSAYVLYSAVLLREIDDMWLPDKQQKKN